MDAAVLASLFHGAQREPQRESELFTCTPAPVRADKIKMANLK
jgi:hypothetical protein